MHIRSVFMYMCVYTSIHALAKIDGCMCVCLDSNQNEYKIKQFYELLSLQIMPVQFVAQEIRKASSLPVNMAVCSGHLYYRIYTTLLTTRRQQNVHSQVQEKKNPNTKREFQSLRSKVASSCKQTDKQRSPCLIMQNLVLLLRRRLQNSAEK